MYTRVPIFALLSFCAALLTLSWYVSFLGCDNGNWGRPLAAILSAAKDLSLGPGQILRCAQDDMPT